MSGGGGQVTPAPDSLGGKVKPSDILGSIAGIAGGAGALGVPIGLPIAAISGIGSAIAKLFGGRLTEKEHRMLMDIQGRVDDRNSRGMK